MTYFIGIYCDNDGGGPYLTLHVINADNEQDAVRAAKNERFLHYIVAHWSGPREENLNAERIAYTLSIIEYDGTTYKRTREDW